MFQAMSLTFEIVHGAAPYCHDNGCRQVMVEAPSSVDKAGVAPHAFARLVDNGLLS